MAGILSDYTCTCVVLKEPPTSQIFRNFLIGRAKSILQEGAHAPTVALCYGKKIEIYTLNLYSTEEERKNLLEAFKGVVQSTGVDLAAYLTPGFIRLSPPDDPYKDVKDQHIADLPGTEKMLNLTVQDKLRHRQYIYRLVELEDGTGYPGPLMLQHDPDIPGGSPVTCPTVIFFDRGAADELH